MRTFWVVCAALVLAASCFSEPMVSVFDFDEGQGNRAGDSSGRNRAARVTAPSWVSGRSGTGLSFAAEGAAVRVGRRPWLNLGAASTLEAWIRPADVGDRSQIIIAKNDEYLLRIDKSSEGGRISFFVHVGTPAVTWEPRVSSKAAPEIGRWSHVAATWDGAKLRLYVNGDLQAERPRVGLPNPNPYPVMIGNFEYPSCHGGNFGGVIDEVRIHDRALAQRQVLQGFMRSR